MMSDLGVLKTDIPKGREYLMVFVLIFLSGNPLGGLLSEGRYIIAAVLMLFYWVSTDKGRLPKGLQKWIVGFAILFIFQIVFIERYSLPAYINFLARLIFVFLVVRSVGDRFRAVYTRVMCFIAMISLPLFLANYAGLEFDGYHIDRYVSVFFYNYIPLERSDQGMRNCGMFWEPGAFQGYLLLIPLMYISNLREFYKYNKRVCYILIAALLTTFSTTGYVALLTLIVLTSLQFSRNMFVKILSIALLCFGAFYAYNNVEFLGNKINGELNNAQNIQRGEISWTRMGSAQIDWWSIQRHAIVGNGFVMEQKYPGLGELMNGAGNGFTGAVNTFGIPLMIIFLFSVLKTAPSTRLYEKYVFLLIYVLVLNGEYFLNYPLFWAMPFIIYPNIAYNKQT